LDQEVDDLSRAMAKLWMGEALSTRAAAVAVSIMNSRVPNHGHARRRHAEGSW